jgi:hypothetical protein
MSKRQIISVIVLTVIALALVIVGYNMVIQKRVLFFLGMVCMVMGIGIFVFLFGLLRK